MEAAGGIAGRDPRDFATLEGGDEYARYFNLLSAVFARLLASYESRTPNDNYERRIVPAYLRRFLFTVEVLRVKYTWARADARPMWLDLSESGFPNSMEIGALAQDLVQRDERLLQLPVASALKRAALDRLLQERVEPVELLRELSERAYFEMLDGEKLFGPFVPGEIAKRSESETHRSYVYSWGCYDFETNRPYVHVMTFDQDVRERPLEDGHPNERAFLDALRAEGSRAPDVGILALAIDDRLESIHPKIVKRLCVGPLLAPLLAARSPAAPADARLRTLQRLVEHHCRDERDGVLFFTEEIVFSKAQTVSRSLLAPRGKVREIFAITETDPECYRRRASVVHRNVLLPHCLLQHVGPEAEAAAPELSRCRKITYDDEGTVVIHG